MTRLLPAHGVLIQHHHMGIYLVGESGVGKSETALQLIHQGAILICDDAPELAPCPDNRKLQGICPKGFYGLMHIRELGLINIIDLFGEQAFNTHHVIDFVIELIHVTPHVRSAETEAAGLAPNYRQWQYQDWTIPGIGLHLYPNRNIPLLITIAVRQFKNNNEQVRVHRP